MLYIETENLIIRNARVSDARALHAFRESEFVMRFNAMDARTLEEAVKALESDSQNDSAAYIELRATGEAIGAIWFTEDDMRYRVNAVATECWLGEPHAHRGYMTEAYRALMPYIFEKTGADLISARVFADNAPSRGLFEKLGFHLDGTLRRAVAGWGGAVHDDALYSLLRAEQPTASGATVYRDMTIDEMRGAYYDDAVNQFPESEMKPCEEIAELMREGAMAAFGAYRDRSLVCYAFTATAPETAALFLQYLAVKKEFHAQGIGTRMLRALNLRYAAHSFIMCDIEDPEKAPADVNRVRRRAFYAKSGYTDVGVRSSVLGVDYAILARPLASQPTQSEVFAAADKIYAKMTMSLAFPACYEVRNA